MNKTAPTGDSVEAHIAAIEDEKQRVDTRKLVEMMRTASGEEPVLWGSIIGFGKMHYKYASGREGDWMVLGLAARKAALTLYGLHMYQHNLTDVEALGKVKTGKGCLYIKRLEDVDEGKLAALMERCYRDRFHEQLLEQYRNQ